VFVGLILLTVFTLQLLTLLGISNYTLLLLLFYVRLTCYLFIYVIYTCVMKLI